METHKICSYCSLTIDNDEFLICNVCNSGVHVKCLKRPGTPGDMLGDVFFTFTCINCATQDIGCEQFKRKKLPWLMIITLTLYNLSKKSNGLSHHGYFHWRTHIVHFINQNWEYLFESTKKKRKKWIGSVSGALSHNSPSFFVSGQEFFKESGWWKLTYNQTPSYYYKLYEQIVEKRLQMKTERRSVDNTNVLSDASDVSTEENKRRRIDSDEEVFSRTLPYMGREPKTRINKQPKPEETTTDTKHLNSVQSSLMDFLAENFPSDGLMFPDIQPENMQKQDILPLIGTPDYTGIFDINSVKTEDTKIDNLLGCFEQDKTTGKSHPKATEKADRNVLKPRILQVTNYQQMDSVGPTTQGITIKEESDSEPDNGFNDNVDEVDNSSTHSIKSLFSKQPKREFPWLTENLQQQNDHENESLRMEGRLIPMSVYEEKELYRKLKQILDSEQECKISIPSYIRRFYRKLAVRELKRSRSKPIFNLDAFGTSKADHNKTTLKPQILDRYQLISTANPKSLTSFHAKIAGTFQYELFESPYTSRILHPFIYRNTKCFPPWLKLMCELEHNVNEKTPSRSTVDFCYVRPNHIAAVNALLETTFWPDIDMSECLSYPDFSVVALYKKLVVGCAFLVPDVGFNEAYISFMAVRPGWQRSGIGSFMLYHLIQTCMNKDITLHVSATNPAVCLYQKFGFKIEEVIVGFYEKYLPIDSNQSRNAFFLRLMR